MVLLFFCFLFYVFMGTEREHRSEMGYRKVEVSMHRCSEKFCKVQSKITAMETFYSKVVGLVFTSN